MGFVYLILIPKIASDNYAHVSEIVKVKQTVVGQKLTKLEMDWDFHNPTRANAF